MAQTRCVYRPRTDRRQAGERWKDHGPSTAIVFFHSDSARDIHELAYLENSQWREQNYLKWMQATF